MIDVLAPITVPLKPQLFPIDITASLLCVAIMHFLFTPIKFELLSERKLTKLPIVMLDLGKRNT